MYGETDDGWPIPVQDAMADILGVRPQEIAGAGHSPAIDQPAATARMLVDFFHDR
jgi:pimeloyl-ACP methyl ester carboxylesterase